MNKEATLAKIKEIGVIAVLRGPSAELTLRMVEALVDGGILGIEITYTTPQATQVVRELSERFGEELLLGMGTLTEPDHARQAQQAGARFVVSPHTEPELAQAMRATGLAMMMGALTPSEIVRSRQLGSDVVKLFPGSQFGPGYLRALRGPFPDLKVMPTGGVHQNNLGEWFAAGAYAVGAGSALCPGAWAEQGRFDDISDRARQFVASAHEVRQSD